MHSHMEMGIMIRQEVAVVPVFLGSCLFFCLWKFSSCTHYFFYLRWKGRAPTPITLEKKYRCDSPSNCAIYCPSNCDENKYMWMGKEDARHFASETPLEFVHRTALTNKDAPLVLLRFSNLKSVAYTHWLFEPGTGSERTRHPKRPE